MILPTISLVLWAAFSPCVSAQLSSILSSLSLTPVPSSLVTEISPESSSLAFLSVPQNASRISTTAFSSSSTTQEVIGITGVAPTASGNKTAGTTTSARPRPTQNTTPCNGHPEFCNRRFSNVTMVVAHNSPFVRARNAASNQVLKVETQLIDGIRGCTYLTKHSHFKPVQLTRSASAIRNPKAKRIEPNSPLPYILRPPRCRNA